MLSGITTGIAGGVAYAPLTAEAAYEPGMMTFDGSTGYYSKASVASSGNAITAMCRINTIDVPASQANYLIFTISGRARIMLIQVGSNIRMYCQNSGGTNLCVLVSNVVINDGVDHHVFGSFDATAGTALLYVDGLDADDTGHAARILTTGTLVSGSGTFTVGGDSVGGWLVDAEVGYCGYRDAYLTNTTDFYHPTNGLQELDVSTWAEWGSQPLVYAPDGKLDTNNLGSVGAFTKNGTITGPA